MTPTFKDGREKKMSAFTFYLDDETKLAVQQRLSMIVPDAKKGALAALIRVLLRQFAVMPMDNEVQRAILMTYKNAIEEEYLYTTKKNKRSKL